ncbi:MAG TPA: 2OG-Fe(II) oxygenase [Bryobacteraceae bacterium]|nr:2OG-Fe(II) oxygenase [Bryobacteraceae bacterium]
MAPAGIASIPEVSSEVVRNADAYRHAFLHRDPFKHVVIESFFEPSFAERLLADFPSFNPRLATNELGLTARKAVNTNIREISPVYQQLYEAIGSKPFLDLVSRISGISDLILDPRMYGGGTHDNQHGQELDPHVDFNYDEAQKLHRRLNLIVYMNKEWSGDWGGALEIHSNPRDPATNRISSYDPLFNRCVMFETNERSWHGFPKIDLPEPKRHLSRKSISIYLYTKDRPADEIAPMHGTFYVQRPLPKHIAAGHTLTEADAQNLQWLLKVRDGWIQAYQRMELEKNREIADTGRLIAELKSHALAPLTGYVLQTGAAIGLHGDAWVASHAELQVRPLLTVSEIVLRGYLPESSPAGRLRVSVGEASAETSIGSGVFEIKVALSQPAQEPFLVKMDFQSDPPLATAIEDRDLAFVLVELSALHPEIVRLPELHKGLESKCRELEECIEHLHAAEHTVEERTAWAQRSTAEAEDLRGQLHALRSNLLVRLARKLRLLP